MLLEELYNKFKHYEYENKSKVEDFYKELRGYILGSLTHGNHLPLSDRQIIVFENAINCLLRDDYASAMCETLDIMQNYNDNSHRITCEEVSCLNTILLVYESRIKSTK